MQLVEFRTRTKKDEKRDLLWLCVLIASMIAVSFLLSYTKNQAKEDWHKGVEEVLVNAGYDNIIFLEDFDTEDDDHMIVYDNTEMTFVGVVQEVDYYASADYLFVRLKTIDHPVHYWKLHMLIDYDDKPDMIAAFAKLEGRLIVLRATYKYDNLGGYLTDPTMVYAFESSKLEEFDPPKLKEEPALISLGVNPLGFYF